MNQRPNISSSAAIIVLAIIAGAGTILPAQALTMGTREFVCPIDGRKFMAKTVNSYTRLGQRLDLKPIGALLAPLPVPVCPTNGFPVYKRIFTPDEIARLKAIVSSRAFKDARKRNSDYYMVGFLKDRMGETKFAVAYSYLRASWETENKKRGLHRRYLALAVSTFDTFAKTARPTTKSWWTAQLLAGNLERRLGRFDAAAKRLSGLPLKAQTPGSIYARVVGQISAAIAARDSAPRTFKPAKK